MATYNILMMGAAYGSLLASKILFGGHRVHHVCLPAEADLINAEFERTALKRLGGSIAFVSRKGFLWKGDQGERVETGIGSGKKPD